MCFLLVYIFGTLLSGDAFSMGLSVPDVTKAEVKKLLEAKVSESTIREFVRVHGPMDPLSSDDLVELKAAGAGTELLQALVLSSASAAQYGRVPYRDYTSPYYYTYSPYYSSYYSYPYFYTHHHDYYPHYLNDFGHGHHYQTHPYLHTFSTHPSSSVHSGHGVHHGGGHGGGGHGGGHH